MPPVVLSRAFPVAELPLPALSVMAEFRLMVNRTIRFALEERKTARGSIPASFRQTLMREHRVNATHVGAALEVALTCAKGHRRFLRKGRVDRVPYCRRPFLKTSKASFHLDALAKDVVIPLYLAGSAARAREERTAREPLIAARLGTS